MKSVFAMTALSLTVLALSSSCSSAADTTQPAFQTATEKLSYTIGTEIGRDMKEKGITVDPTVLAKGLADALAGKKPAMTDEQMHETMMAFQKEMGAKEEEEMKKAEAKFKEESDKNQKASATYLAANKAKDGVKTTATGLQYKVIKTGTGAMPKAADTVTVHYKGTLIDGTEFDNSYKRNEPAVFACNRIIPGWTEGLQLMPVGSKYELVIPSELAYGAEGRPPRIGPNAVLVFEVELLGIQAPSAPTTQPEK